MKIMYTIIFIIIGMVLGSFYNVLGFRLPKSESILKPRSHCPKCNHYLKWYELIPVFSYIIQKGRCLNCKEKISVFYPLIELFTGLLFGIAYYSFGFTPNLYICLALISVLMIIMVSDLNFMIIPDEILIFFSIVILVIKVFGVGLLQTGISIMYGLLMFLIMYLIMLLGNKLFKKESLGGGDIKLMFLVGIVLHPTLAIFSIFLASVMALPVSLIIYKKNKEHVIPFGPFIALAAVLLYFFKVDISIFNTLLFLN